MPPARLAFGAQVTLWQPALHPAGDYISEVQDEGSSQRTIGFERSLYSPLGVVLTYLFDHKVHR